MWAVDISIKKKYRKWNDYLKHSHYFIWLQKEEEKEKTFSHLLLIKTSNQISNQQICYLFIEVKLW